MIARGPKFMLKLWHKQASRSTTSKNLSSWRYKFKVTKTKKIDTMERHICKRIKFLTHIVASKLIWPLVILQETSQSQNIWQEIITESP